MMCMPNRNGEGKKVLDRLFPMEYDFYQLLVDQTERTYEGVKEFQRWLENGHLSDVDHLIAIEERLDDLRYDLQHKLHEAFSTPFDREEIYSLSRQMDNILNFAVLTAKQMRAYGVPPDQASKDITSQLTQGMGHMAMAMRYLQKGDPRADMLIVEMRNCQRAIEDQYIRSMEQLFSNPDTLYIIKHAEIYQNLMATGNNLRICIDMFHRILVGIM
ncbi:MAG: hypothetical protein A4E32_00122 [Methanomassiliicoccales archaeon PtaU1.Bin124]|nr:MAG: hypothetical protein A4E32_00122 [Methanomassiliicoccales archaeon PtaU1.Bin124]